MKIALLLHAYQPPTQFPYILSRIVEETYKPLISLLHSAPKGKITLNFAGSLTELLVNNEEQTLLEDLGKAAAKGRVELVGTAAYHPLLPKIPSTEIIRQDRVNRQINSDFFPKGGDLRGFFIPEMWYDRRVGGVISEIGYDWTVLSESGYEEAGIEENGQHNLLGINKSLYRLKGTPLHIFFRDRPLSLMMAFDASLTLESFLLSVRRHIEASGDEYVVIALDAETFGHHIKHNMILLEEILNQDDLEVVGVSDLLELDLPVREIEPLESTWGITKVEQGERVFPRWVKSDNEIHTLQWELFNIALHVGEHSNEDPDMFDRSLHSDQFWWASRTPCWHLELVKSGASMLLDVVRKSSRATKKEKTEAEELFDKIVRRSIELYGTDIVLC
jgi:alpha-amylase/alpha-mannosidase (GH57 family)